MAKTIQVRAREDLTYQGRSHPSGDLFHAAIPDALALRHRRKVDFAPGARAPSPPITATASSPEPPVELPPVNAEAPPPDLVADEVDEPASDESPRRSRRYKRRDLEPER